MVMGLGQEQRLVRPFRLIGAETGQEQLRTQALSKCFRIGGESVMQVGDSC